MTTGGGGSGDQSWRWRTYPLAVIGSVLAAVVLVVLASDGRDSLTGGLGGDFVEFHAAGEIVLDGDGDQLFDVDRQVAAQAPHWDEAGSVILFAYPPAVAALYVPLALLDFRLAYLLHTLAMVGALAGALVLLRGLVPLLAEERFRLAALAASLTFLPMFFGVALGQNTALVLLGGTVAWWGLHHHRDLVAGVALGLLVLKPQYGVPVLGLVVLARRWGAVAVAAGTAAVLWGVSALVSGAGWVGPWVDLVRSLSEVDQGVNLHNEVSWLGLAEVVFGAGSGVAMVLWILLGGATVAALLWRLWQRPVLDHLTVALVLPTILLVAPHALYYDAGLLLVSAGALVTTLEPRHRAPVLVVWWLAGLGHVGASTLGVQPVALLVIGTWIWAFVATGADGEVRSRRPRRAAVTG